LLENNYRFLHNNGTRSEDFINKIIYSNNKEKFKMIFPNSKPKLINILF